MNGMIIGMLSSACLIILACFFVLWKQHHDKKKRHSILLVISLSSIAVVCFIAVILTWFWGRHDVNSNRYGSMDVFDGSLYYYANGYIYKYSDRENEKIEKAASIFFHIEKSKEEKKLTIVYDEESTQKYEMTPYAGLLDGATGIVYDDNYLYARYPGGSSYIQVYKIDQAAGKLREYDEIRY